MAGLAVALADLDLVVDLVDVDLDVDLVDVDLDVDLVDVDLVDVDLERAIERSDDHSACMSYYRAATNTARQK